MTEHGASPGSESMPALLADRYELGAEIGRGGMGVVYRCLDRQSGEHRAVKMLTANRMQDEEDVRRFQQEAKVLTRFAHPNIITIYDFGIEGELPYLVSELCLTGDNVPTSLDDLQRNAPNRQVPPHQLTALVPPIVAALADLHASGLVHRDIKPGNILLKESTDGTLVPKLSDFGLVAITGDAALREMVEFTMSLNIEQESAHGMALVGTYAYMSPEQKRGELLDARSDVYSLGLMVYRLATGYERVSFALPSEVVPGMPGWVDELVKASVDTAKEQRAPSAEALYELLPKELRRFRSCKPVMVKEPRPSDSTPPKPAPATVPAAPPPPESLPTPPRPPGPVHLVSPIAIAAVATFLVLAAAAVLIVALRYARTPAAPPAPSLAELLASDTPQDVQNALLQLHGATGDNGQDLLPDIERVLRHPNVTIRRTAAKLVGELGQDNPRVQLPVLACLQDSDPAVVAYALQAIRQWSSPPPEARDAVYRTFLNSQGTTRREAVQTLTHLDPPADVAYLEYHLFAGNTGVLLELGDAALPALRQALQAPDPTIRRHAVEVFAEMGAAAKPVLSDLVSLLRGQESEVRRAAAQALVAIGHPAIPPLMDLAHDPDETARSLAIDTIEAIGVEPKPAYVPYYVHQRDEAALVGMGADAVPSLIPFLHGDNDDARKVAIGAIRALGPQGAAATPHLATLLQTRFAGTGGTAVIDALAAIGPEARSAGPALMTIFSVTADPRHDAAAAALEAIRVPPEERYLPFFLYLARQGTSRESVAFAIRSLGQTGGNSAEARNLVLDALRSADTTLAEAGLAATVDLGAGALPGLKSLLGGGNAQQRLRAVEACVRLGDTAKPLLADLSRQLVFGGDLARSAAGALATFGRPGTGQLLAALADPRSQAVAIQALSELPAEQRQRTLLDLRNAMAGDDRTTRQAAVKILGAWGSDARPAVSDLVLALGAPTRFDREQVLAALAEIGPAADEALPAIRQLLAVPNDSLREQAVRALARIGGPGIVYVGEALASDTPAVSRQALTELVALGPAAAPAIPHLEQAFRGGNVTTRQTILQLFARMGPAAGPAVPLLREALSDPLSTTRGAAVAALGEVGAAAKHALPDLRELETDQSDLVSKPARVAVEKIERALQQ